MEKFLEFLIGSLTVSDDLVFCASLVFVCMALELFAVGCAMLGSMKR